MLAEQQTIAEPRATGTEPPPVVSAVILSFNTRQLTLDCLRALYADLADLPNEVWVVDNASTDGSVEAIRAAFPQVRVIANDVNVGFGAANNQAMRRANGEFLLLINSDAFVKPGGVEAMIRCFKRHPETGVVGPRLLNADGTLQQSCFHFPSPGRAWAQNLWITALMPGGTLLGDYRRWGHDEERSVEWVSGACFMLRRAVFEQTDGFDPAFFMYAEETDWQKRIRRRGWDIRFVPTAVVVHLGGASGGHDRSRRDQNFFGSLDRYQIKHHGRAGLVLLRLAMIVGCALRTLLWSLVLLAHPGRRAAAAGKVRLHSWLVVRQLTMWRLPHARA